MAGLLICITHIGEANKDIANRKHTSLFCVKVNCTSKAKASHSVRAILK